MGWNRSRENGVATHVRGIRKVMWKSLAGTCCSYNLKPEEKAESVVTDYFEAGKKHADSESGGDSLCPTADVKLDPKNKEARE